MLEDVGLPPFVAFMLVLTLVVHIASILMNKSINREQTRIDQ